MLRITTSHSGEALVSYFHSDLIKDGNYFLDSARKTFFEGQAAKHLELDGQPVTKELFYKLAHNIDPRSLNNKTLTVLNVSNRKSGFDFTFSASKSLSVVHAITKDPAILEAHRLAYRKAMAFVEDNAITQANTQASRGYQHTGNILMMAFDHFTSRGVEMHIGGEKHIIPDCQLHTHCIVPNFTWNPHKKRFQALEMGKTHEIASYVEEIYHAHLSRELVKTGYAIRRTKDRYEIEGVSKDIIDRFSNRTTQIEKIAKEQNITDPVEKAKIGAYSRTAKSKIDDRLDLDKIWRDRLSQQELKDLQSLKGKKAEKVKAISPKEAVDRALDHHLQRNSTAKEKMVLAYALKLGYGQLLPEDLSKELNSRTDILKDEVDKISHITTKNRVLEEEKMIAMARDGKGKFKPLNENYEPEQAFLNDQQKAAIHQILTSTSQTVILRGSAGVGKTTLLQNVKNAVEQTGKTFFATAPSAQASRGVMRRKGFEADTVAALLHSPKLQEKLKDACLLVDEAGTLGVNSMSRIQALVKQYNTKLILSGDTKQNGPPGQYGDALRILQDKAKIETATVQKIVRQKQSDLKKAVEKLAIGKTQEGYSVLDKMGVIKEIPDHDKRLQTIAKDYTRSLKAKRSAMIISPTNAEGDVLAQIVREHLKKEKIIKGKERQFDILKPLRLTEAQKKDAMQYEAGQIIRFAKNQKGGFKAGQHYPIKSVDDKGQVYLQDSQSGKTMPLPIKTPDYYDLYEKRQALLAKGDVLRLTNNLKTIEQTKVNNGGNYQVKGFTRKGDIKLSNGKTLSKDAMHFKQGYVETSDSSQGKDCQDIYISMSDMSFAASNAQQFYVSVSRGIHSAKIYTNDQDRLKQVINRSGERLTAKEIARGHNLRMMREKQKAHHQNLSKKQQDYGREQRKPALKRNVSGNRSKTDFYKP